MDQLDQNEDIQIVDGEKQSLLQYVTLSSLILSFY